MHQTEHAGSDGIILSAVLKVELACIVWPCKIYNSIVPSFRKINIWLVFVFFFLYTVIRCQSSNFYCVQVQMDVLRSLLTSFIQQLFLQILKIIFSSRFPKDKNDADFSKNLLQKQEKVGPKAYDKCLFAVNICFVFSVKYVEKCFFTQK